LALGVESPYHSLATSAQEGRIVIGKSLSHFKITAKLGEGGMGEVYHAEDTKLGRGVAIKLLPQTVSKDPDRLGRFEREAKVLASLNHPNIAGIHQVEHADDVFFLVMELIEGEDLKERISRGKLPLDEALSIASQIAEALEEAHNSGIVHRDLKPANVKITPDGKVKVLDFGLAKALGDDPETSGASGAAITHSPTLTANMTGAGILIGTAAYMSPEQARGQAADRRADIWAFGVVLFEMLTGSTVYAGDTVSDTLAGVLAREPEWGRLSDATPRPLRRLLERCLEKDIKQRLQAIGEARIAIERYRDNPTAEEPQTEAIVETAPTSTWKRLFPWAAVALLVPALAITLVGQLGGSGPTGPESMHSTLVMPESQSLHRGYGSPVIVSPAGDKVVHVFQEGTNHEIHLRAIDQWEGSVLHAGQGPERPYHPFFSPDGNWLGFVTINAIKKMPISGGTPIKLTDVNLNRGATWAPDGTIIFTPDPSSPLFRIPEAGGEAEPLTELDKENNETTHRWPQILPQGKAVLFTVHSQGSGFDSAWIEVLDLESKERHVVHRGGTFARYAESGHLIYMNQGTLFAMPFDLSSLQPTGSPAPVVEGVGDSAEGGAYYDVSRNGVLVFSAGGVGGGTLLKALWVDRDGRLSPLTEEERAYASPRLSPDGNRLAVEIETEGNTDIWILDLDRDVPTRLTFQDGYDGVPVWSPDGQTIAFQSDRGDGPEAVYVKSADGSGEAELIGKSDQLLAPWSWSPDGKHIAIMIQNPETQLDLAILSVEEGTIEPFLSTKFIEYGPGFSPDGKWIVYGSNESGDWEAYVRPADGSRGKWQVSSGGATYPVWSGDGKEIFLANVQGVILAVDVDTSDGSFRASRPRELFKGPFADLTSNKRMYTVSPDGQRFVLFQGEVDQTASGHEHVRVISNWFAQLERTFSK
jgi:serine/threonine-protein kinase